MDSDAKTSLLARLGSANPSEAQAEVSPKEPQKGEAYRSSGKSSIKTNMVAREVRVKVTGVHPGNNGAPELFTEEASSMLVHQTGGVIQLSTAVARGQLVLLVNVESKREVVAQVKRTYQPMNRCVELEFAESAPRFWGMEFSAATALLPKDAKYVEATALISERGADDTGEPPPAPTAEEVEALRRELEARGEMTVSSAPPTQFVPVSVDPGLAQVTIEEESQLPRPPVDFPTPLAKPKLFRARGNFTPGAVPRLLMLTIALVITAIGAAWFRHGILWKAAVRKPSPGVPVVGASVSTSLPPKSVDTAKDHFELSGKNVASEMPTASPPVPSQPAEPVARALKGSPAPSAAAAKRSASRTPASKAESARPTTRNTPDSFVASAADAPIVPPKLIKSVTAVASLDAVRDFETGNVVIDAVVGTEGEVHFITVISGPPSLRGPAAEAAKQYRYEPATRNGQPVPEHVRITIRFRFES